MPFVGWKPLGDNGMEADEQVIGPLPRHEIAIRGV
jgi:hypothetical protein